EPTEVPTTLGAADRGGLGGRMSEVERRDAIVRALDAHRFAVSGVCECGVKPPRGGSLAEHQADAVVAALSADSDSPDRGAQWDVMRAVRARGGKIDRCTTRYDHDREGRVLTLEAFYPGTSGYPGSADSDSTPREATD